MHLQETAETQPDLDHLARGWRTLTVGTVAGMIVGGLLLTLIKPLQEASAKVLLEQRDSSLEAKSRSVQEKEFLPTQAEVMASPAIVARAVHQTESVSSEAELAARTTAAMKHLKVDPLAGTNILVVRYAGLTAADAVRFVGALIDHYREYITDAEQKRQKQLLASLTARHAEYEKTLSSLNAEYAQLTETRVSQLTADADTSARVIAMLEGSLATLQSRRMLLERAQSQIHNAIETTLTPRASATSVTANGLPIVSSVSQRDDNALTKVIQELAILSKEPWSGIQNPSELETRLLDARSRVNELRTMLGPQHPELVAANAAVVRVEQECSRIVQTAPVTIRLAMSGILAEEQSLRERYDAVTKQAKDSGMMQLLETRKLEEINQLKQAGEITLTRLRQLQTTDPLEITGQSGISITLIEPPRLAERSFVANPLVIIGISGILGLLLGISLLAVMPQQTRSQGIRLPNRGPAADVPERQEALS